MRPRSALDFCSQADTKNATQSLSGGPSFGVHADGVSGAVGCCDTHNAGTSNCWSYHSATQQIWSADNDANDKATVSSLLKNGVRLNWNALDTENHYFCQLLLR
jgi:hypothetical protein